jgi:hypothetical protein
MLPEQTVSIRGAISVAAVCEAYKLAPEPDGAERVHAQADPTPVLNQNTSSPPDQGER